MATITTRSGKGSALTHTELDNNFTNLNTDKVEASGDTITGNLDFNDNVKAQFGAGQDLEIYHDGSHSYIDEVGTGSLYVRANDFRLANADGTQNHITAANSGAVSLRYSGSPKLATTSTGVDVTGTVTADDLDVVSSTNATARIEGGSNGDASLRLTESGTSGFQFKYDGGDNNLYIGSGTSGTFDTRIAVNRDSGDVSLYEDTGTTAKFFWDASAEQLKLGTIQGAAGGSFVAKTDSNGYALAIEENSGTERWSVGVDVDGDLGFFNSTDTSASVTFDDSGNVGIGTGDPQQKVHIDDGGLQIRANTGYGQLSLISKNNVTSAGQKITFMAANRDDSNEEYASIQGLLQSNEGGSGNVQTGHLRFSTSGDERMRITHTGEVCIGRTDGETNLDIAGTRRLANGNVTTGSKVLTEFNFTVSNTGSTAGDTWLLAATVELTTGNYKAAVFEYTISDPNTNYGNSKTIEKYTGLIRMTRTESTTQDDPYDAFVYGPTMTGPDIQVYKNSAGKYEIQVKHTGSNQFATFDFKLLSGSPIITLPVNGSTAETYAGLASSTGGTAYTRTQHNVLGTRHYMDIGSANVSDGIFFGGAATANKLDDYEEGTFTPVVEGGTTAGTGTYSTQNGAYTKVGNKVTAHISLNMSAHTGSGAIRIPLPFTSTGQAVGVVMDQNFNYSTNASLVVFTQSQTFIQFYAVGDNAPWALQILEQDSAFTVFISITYRTAA